MFNIFLGGSWGVIFFLKFIDNMFLKDMLFSSKGFKLLEVLEE